MAVASRLGSSWWAGSLRMVGVGRPQGGQVGQGSGSVSSRTKASLPASLGGGPLTNGLQLL